MTKSQRSEGTILSAIIDKEDLSVTLSSLVSRARCISDGSVSYDDKILEKFCSVCSEV